MSITKKRNKITVKTLQELKKSGEKISMLTAYDFTMASILDQAGIDVILVGDSASNVFAGNDTTIPITLDEMLYHSKCVKRGVKRSLVVADLPFGTYQGNPEKALFSAIRLMKEAAIEAVKLEGGAEVIESVNLLVQSGIPTMGHLGLTPQSINQFGTYTVRAKEKAEADKLRKDVQLLEDAGIFGLVLEKIPAKLAQEITEKCKVPTIGIGAGSNTDGQVLVVNDMLGMNNEFSPRFVRKYLDLETEISGAVKSYISDIKKGNFPNAQEQY